MSNDDEDALELTAYPLGGGVPVHKFRPAERLRQWQLDTNDAYATRCLPLNIANCHGWEGVIEGGFDAIWNGDPGLNAVEVIPHGDGPVPAASHFGVGVLTFILGVIFKTPRGHNLMVQGPINVIKDGIQPLSGIIETDWSPYSFTMNWKFSRPCRVRFEKGEPVCHIAPIPRGYMEKFKPVIRNLERDDPELAADFNN